MKSPSRTRRLGFALPFAALVVLLSSRWGVDDSDFVHLEPRQVVVVTADPGSATCPVAAGTLLEVVADDWDDRDDGSRESRRERRIVVRFRPGSNSSSDPFEIRRANVSPY